MQFSWHWYLLRFLKFLLAQKLMEVLHIFCDAAAFPERFSLNISGIGRNLNGQDNNLELQVYLGSNFIPARYQIFS